MPPMTVARSLDEVSSTSLLIFTRSTEGFDRSSASDDHNERDMAQLQRTDTVNAGDVSVNVPLAGVVIFIFRNAEE